MQPPSSLTVGCPGWPGSFWAAAAGSLLVPGPVSTPGLLLLFVGLGRALGQEQMEGAGAAQLQGALG